MKYSKQLVLFYLFLLSSLSISAQRNVTTVGIQFKPIFPLEFVGTGETTNIDQEVEFKLGLKSGFAGGMVVRHGFSDLLSLESGINYVKRKYNLKIIDREYEQNANFRIVGYEIPVSLLVYIQLGEKLYMNVSMGASLDMFASAVQAFDSNFSQISFRNHVAQGAIIANIGWEWRTEKSGYFYIGSSYHRPFDWIYESQTAYYKPNVPRIDPAISVTELLGNYLTIDLRYFFHEDPETKKQRKRK